MQKRPFTSDLVKHCTGILIMALVEFLGFFFPHVRCLNVTAYIKLFVFERNVYMCSMPHPVNECIHVRRWVYCCSLCMDVCRVVGVRERDQAQLCAPG